MYSSIASRIFFFASLIVSPSLKQPGNAGTVAVNPPNSWSAVNNTLYCTGFVFILFVRYHSAVQISIKQWILVLFFERFCFKTQKNALALSKKEVHHRRRSLSVRRSADEEVTGGDADGHSSHARVASRMAVGRHGLRQSVAVPARRCGAAPGVPGDFEGFGAEMPLGPGRRRGRC